MYKPLSVIIATLMVSACGGGGDGSNSQAPFLTLSTNSVVATFEEETYTPLNTVVEASGGVSIQDDNEKVSFRLRGNQLEGLLEDGVMPTSDAVINVTLKVGDIEKKLTVMSTLRNTSLERRKAIRDLTGESYQIANTQQIGANLLELGFERLYWQGTLSFDEKESGKAQQAAAIEPAFLVFAERYAAWQSIDDGSNETEWEFSESNYLEAKASLERAYNLMFDSISRAEGLPSLSIDTNNKGQLTPAFFYGNTNFGEGDYATFQYSQAYAFLQLLAVPAAQCDVVFGDFQ
tara:strand:+ start:53915 stop:54787 length:873 start_codon:yes stop_codon:yes gene_type:complete